MTLSLSWVQQPDKLDNIIAANFKSGKCFISLKTYIFRNLIIIVSFTNVFKVDQQVLEVV